MSDPNEVLAGRTIDRLVTEGLLTEQEGRKLLTSFAKGRLGQDDWKIAFENSKPKEKAQ